MQPGQAFAVVSPRAQVETSMTQSVDLPVARSGSFPLGGERRVYRLGFGAMRLTGKGTGAELRDHDQGIAVLRRWLGLGVNLIDTADSYGPAVSERLIAEALYPYPPELVIATKAGLERPGPDQWTPNGRPEHLRAACEGSLRRLRLERIELYQLHRIDPAVPLDDQLGTLRELQRQGKTRHIECHASRGERRGGAARAERRGFPRTRSRLTVATHADRADAAEVERAGARRPRRTRAALCGSRAHTGMPCATCFHRTTGRSGFCPPPA